MEKEMNRMMHHLPKNYQGGMQCWITTRSASSQVPELIVAEEVSPYRCSDATACYEYTLDEEWSKAVRLSYASGVAAKFPEKLHQMLEEIRQKGDESIVSWLPHGRAFRVHKKQQFIETVLPTFFGHSNYTSFTRQLNLYCFKLVKAGEDKGAYHHELFLRSHPYRCHKMVRQVVKGDRTKKFCFAPSESYCNGMHSSKLLKHGKYEQHKDMVPKADSRKNVVSKGENTEENVVGCASSPTSQAKSMVPNNISWMDSFPLLCGVPYCQEPTGSFVASLLEAKCSYQTESRNFDDISIFSDNCFSAQSQEMFRVDNLDDLVEFDDYQGENESTSAAFQFKSFCDF